MISSSIELFTGMSFLIFTSVMLASFPFFRYDESSFSEQQKTKIRNAKCTSELTEL